MQVTLSSMFKVHFRRRFIPKLHWPPRRFKPASQFGATRLWRNVGRRINPIICVPDLPEDFTQFALDSTHFGSGSFSA